MIQEVIYWCEDQKKGDLNFLLENLIFEKDMIIDSVVPLEYIATHNVSSHGSITNSSYIHSALVVCHKKNPN